MIPVQNGVLKEHPFGIRQTQVQILVLPFSYCVTQGRNNNVIITSCYLLPVTALISGDIC